LDKLTLYAIDQKYQLTMKIAVYLIVLVLPSFIGFSCKKESAKTYCWQLTDPIGNTLNSVCGKTEAQMQVSYSNPCTYYKLGDEYCWYIDNMIFITNKPQDFIDRYLHCFGHTSAIKVACDYCQTWYTREKYTYKPNNTFTYSQVRVQQYCGDTVHTLYQGREIILRESNDSLITLQFSNNGIF